MANLSERLRCAAASPFGSYAGEALETLALAYIADLTEAATILDRLTVEGLAGVADAAVNDWWADYSAGRVDSGESSVYVARAIIAYINTGEEPQALAALSDTPRGREEEGKQGLMASRDLKPTTVASSLKGSDVGEVKP